MRGEKGRRELEEWSQRWRVRERDLYVYLACVYKILDQEKIRYSDPTIKSGADDDIKCIYCNYLFSKFKKHVSVFCEKKRMLCLLCSNIEK